MLQIIYVSTANPALGAVDPEPILAMSRALNLRDSITGLLYSDGKRFMQVIEGPSAETETCMDRIRRDLRHRSIVRLVHRHVDQRAFGDWSMAHLERGSEADAFVDRVDALVADAPPSIRATFAGFAHERRKTLSDR
jgi:hypothetical protein